MKIFAQNLTQLMPAGITLPPELIETFDWLEDQGWHQIRNEGAPEDHWLSIYPADQRDSPSAGHVAFGGTTLAITSHWSEPDAAVDARIAEIATISGDGGRAAIWLDENGKQQFVQLGHDNCGVITADPLVFLQYLAMGYPEAGALQKTDISPTEQYELHGTGLFPGTDKGPIVPAAFQEFLKTRFNLAIPATARDLGITDFPEYGDPDTTDTFALWFEAVTPPPSEADLAYEMELMRTIESLDLKDDDSSDAILGKIGSLFKSKD